MTLGEFVVGVSTMILGIATFLLGFIEMTEGKETREQTLLITDRERRRLRLKEQLEGLYSPLMAHIENIDQKHFHSRSGRDIHDLMHNKIKYNYELLATKPLRDKLRNYFKFKYTLEDLSQEHWEELINPIIETIQKDYEDLFKEYDDLTKSIE